MATLRLTVFFPIAVVILLSTFSTRVNSQCRDQSVSNAVREVTGRAASGSAYVGECNIQNYGNGSWAGYADLVNKVRAAGVCKDPWITLAFKEVANRTPAGWSATDECNAQLYNSGSYNSYTQLRNAVRVYVNSLKLTPIHFVAVVRPGLSMTTSPNALVVVAAEGSIARLQAKIVSAAGGSLVGGDGASVLTQGGGNLLTQGGGNLLTQGGGILTVPQRPSISTRSATIAGDKTLKY
jgi:hypothetical protein